MKTLKSLAALSSVTLLASCATIVQGTADSVQVNAIPGSNGLGATICDLKNGRGTWNVPAPGTALVKKSKTDLEVSCKNSVTGATGKQVIKSDVDAWYFGNVLFGGIVGLVIDPATGSMWKYPGDVTVNLVASQPSAPAETITTPPLPGQPPLHK